MTGKEKKIDIKNPPFMPKNRTSFKSSIFKLSKKLVLTYFPYIAYPTLPTRM